MNTRTHTDTDRQTNTRALTHTHTQETHDAWLPPSKTKMVEFLREMETRHNKTHSAVIELLHGFDMVIALNHTHTHTLTHSHTLTHTRHTRHTLS